MCWGIFPLYCSKRDCFCGSLVSNRNKVHGLMEWAQSATGGVWSAARWVESATGRLAVLRLGSVWPAPGLPRGPPAGGSVRTIRCLPRRSSRSLPREMPGPGLRAAVSVGPRAGPAGLGEGHPSAGRCPLPQPGWWPRVPGPSLARCALPWAWAWRGCGAHGCSQRDPSRLPGPAAARLLQTLPGNEA